MKGRLFKSKPLPPKNEILEFFCTRPKPWSKNPEKVYNWRSSIPEKWVSLKGHNYFRHSSEIDKPKLSIELLSNSKKYLHLFRANSQEKIAKLSSIPIESTSPVTLRKRRASLPINRKSPEKTLLVTGESNTQFFNFRPNTVREIRINSATKNSKIDDFLQRFDRKPGIKEHLPANKGLFGWKLRHLKDSKDSKIKRPDYCQIFNVKKNSDNPFSTISSKRVYSIS